MAPFRSPLRRKKRAGIGAWWAWWRAPIFLTIIMAVWWFVLRPVTAPDDWVPPQLSFGLCGQKDAGRACVIDGDTLHIRRGDKARRIRITGFDAPELDGPCPAERAKALDAQRALYQWLAAGAYEWDGGDDPPFDQYGRELRSIRRPDGKGGYEELADYMLEGGLAAQSGWGATPKDWCS